MTLRALGKTQSACGSFTGIDPAPLESAMPLALHRIEPTVETARGGPILLVLQDSSNAPPASLRLATEIASSRKERLILLRVLPLVLHSVTGPCDRGREEFERESIEGLLAGLRSERIALPRIEVVFAFGSLQPMIAECAEHYGARLVLTEEPRGWLRSLWNRTPRLLVTVL
jgi:hypothetical protein